MDIIYRSVFYLKHEVSETRICPRLQVLSNQLVPVDRANPCVRTEHLKTQKASSLRNNMFK
jgi:hypothetical protein